MHVGESEPIGVMGVQRPGLHLRKPSGSNLEKFADMGGICAPRGVARADFRVGREVHKPVEQRDRFVDMDAAFERTVE